MSRKKSTNVSNDETKTVPEVAKTSNLKDILIFMRKETFVSNKALKCHMKYSLSQEIVDLIPAENYIKVRTK